VAGRFDTDTDVWGFCTWTARPPSAFSVEGSRSRIASSRAVAVATLSRTAAVVVSREIAPKALTRAIYAPSCTQKVMSVPPVPRPVWTQR
jgi:hypothetical protein